MQCENCHAPLEDGAQFCANCGSAVKNPAAQAIVNDAGGEQDLKETPATPETKSSTTQIKPTGPNTFMVLTFVFGFVAIVTSVLAIVGFSSQKTTTPDPATTTPTTTTVTTGSSEKVIFEGYTLNVPVGYSYEFYADEEGQKYLHFTNPAGTNIISLKYYKTLTYSAIGEKVSALAASFAEQLKGSTTKFGHESVSGMEFHTVDVTMEDKSSVMYAWAKAGLYSFMGYLHSTTGASSELLSDYAKIMNGATQQTQTQIVKEKYPKLFEEKFLDLKFDILTE